MSQKIELPMRGSPRLCSGPPGSMMIVRGGQNITTNMSYSNVVADRPMSYSNAVADRPKVPQKPPYPVDNNVDERIRKSVKAGPPIKPSKMQNMNGAAAQEEKVRC